MIEIPSDAVDRIVKDPHWKIELPHDVGERRSPRLERKRLTVQHTIDGQLPVGEPTSFCFGWQVAVGDVVDRPQESVKRDSGLTMRTRENPKAGIEVPRCLAGHFVGGGVRIRQRRRGHAASIGTGFPTAVRTALPTIPTYDD